MLEAIGQFFSALESRIKSNIIGFVLFAFVVLNWRPLFILIFSGYDALERIRHFDDLSSLESLVLYPLVFGLLAAVLSPWINFMGAKLVRKPIRLLNKMHEDEASQRRIRLILLDVDENRARADAERVRAEKEKAEAEKEKAEADKLAAQEQRKIEAAKRIEGIRHISDEDVRKLLVKDIKGLRNSARAESDLPKLWNSLIFDEKQLLKLAMSRPEGAIRFEDSEFKYRVFQGTLSFNLPSRQEYISMVSAADKLKEKGLLEYDEFKETYLLTAIAYDLLKKFGAEEI